MKISIPPQKGVFFAPQTKDNEAHLNKWWAREWCPTKRRSWHQTINFKSMNLLSFLLCYLVMYWKCEMWFGRKGNGWCERRARQRLLYCIRHPSEGAPRSPFKKRSEKKEVFLSPVHLYCFSIQLRYSYYIYQPQALGGVSDVSRRS